MFIKSWINLLCGVLELANDNMCSELYDKVCDLTSLVNAYQTKNRDLKCTLIWAPHDAKNASQSELLTLKLQIIGNTLCIKMEV